MDSSARVRSMLGIYDRLYLTGNYHELSAREYLGGLVNEIGQEVKLAPKRTGSWLQGSAE